MHRLSWLITLPATLFFVVFALNNRMVVDLSFWPFPITVSAPLYLFFILTVFISFVLGAIIMWLGQHKHRAAARDHQKNLKKLQQQLASTTVPAAAESTTTVTALIKDNG